MKPFINVRSTAKIRSQAKSINYDTAEMPDIRRGYERDTTCLICGEPGYTICKSCGEQFPIKSTPKDERINKTIKNFTNSNLTGETLNET